MNIESSARIARCWIMVGGVALVSVAAPGCDEPAHAAVAAPRSAALTPGPIPDPPAPGTIVAPLDEAQAVDVLATLNRGEISLAQYALTRATSPSARALAQMMIDQHTEVQANVTAWAQTAVVTASPSPVSTTVRESVSAVRNQLATTSDTTFDAEYVQSQITLHQDALTILDERLLPGAHDETFRALLTTIRAGIATHLAHAIAIRDVH